MFKIFDLTLTLLSILILVFIFLFPPVSQHIVKAQSCPTSSTNPNVTGGIISAPSIAPAFTSREGVCNQGTAAAFFSQKIPTFEGLKAQYYDNARAGVITVQITSTSLPSLSDQTVYFRNGELNISSAISGSGTAVIFVNTYLNITTDINYGDASSGLVFVVKGNVYIAENVRTINAVIISSGKIYTAASQSVGSCDKSSVQTDDPLVINGSLISNWSDAPTSTQLTNCTNNPDSAACPQIRFCRTLRAGNTRASEQINHQVKYLVLLRNILSETKQSWSEIQ